MIEIKKENKGIIIILQASAMGRDLNVSITGGDIPHLGAIALGIPRPSRHNPGSTSATVSVLTLTSHKEDEIVRPAAHFLASSLNVSVVVSCGIHINDIKPEEIYLIDTIVHGALQELLEALKGSG